MRYFAMIGDERQGPFTLVQLHDAGVRPDTYVWCKGMDDWKKAREVADICRFYRQHIDYIMHPASYPEPADLPDKDPVNQSQPSLTRFPGIGGGQIFEEPKPDYSIPPRTMIVESILLTILCAPFPGLVAVFYALNTRRKWQEGKKEEAYENSRRAKMWCGITFFFGFFVIAILSRYI